MMMAALSLYHQGGGEILTNILQEATVTFVPSFQLQVHIIYMHSAADWILASLCLLGLLTYLEL